MSARALITGIAALFLATGTAHANDAPILKSLSPEIQKSIKETRGNCIRGVPTEDDDGLVAFTVSGKSAVLVDELNLCVNEETHQGVNYATGFSHTVDIYVRNGTWNKTVTIDATGEISLSLDDHDKFKNLVLSVHGGSPGCPLRDKISGTAWKREKCDLHVRWDGTKFVYRFLKTSKEAVHTGPQLPEQMTGTWCFDKELTEQNIGQEPIYLRSTCADSDVIVVKTDGFVTSNRRCKFNKIVGPSNPTDQEYWVWGHCVESAELGDRGRPVPMGNNGGLRFELINNLQLKIRGLPCMQ